MKAKQKRKSGTIRELHPKEWDFSSCPQDQLHWCSVYEHSRDNEKVVDAVKHFRASGAWRAEDRVLFPDERYRRMAERVFELFPEFPLTPYLVISPIERRGRCVELSELRSELVVFVIKSEAAV
jgi:hypothetical protein